MGKNLKFYSKFLTPYFYCCQANGIFIKTGLCISGCQARQKYQKVAWKSGAASRLGRCLPMGSGHLQAEPPPWALTSTVRWLERRGREKESSARGSSGRGMGRPRGSMRLDIVTEIWYPGSDPSAAGGHLPRKEETKGSVGPAPPSQLTHSPKTKLSLQNKASLWNLIVAPKKKQPPFRTM